MDFSLTMTDGRPEMTMAEAADYRNNVFLSLFIPKGKFFAAPYFGSRRWEIKKITSENVLRLKQFDEEALRWIVTTMRAKSIDIVTARDSQAADRINEHIRVVWANDEITTFETFYEVV